MITDSFDQNSTSTGAWDAEEAKGSIVNHVCLALLVSSALTTSSVDMDAMRISACYENTGSGVEYVSSTDFSSTVSISDLRNLTALPWARLAEIFDVSRRTVHLWSSGNQMNSSNQTKLGVVFNLLKKLGTDDVKEVKRFLLTGNGEYHPLELLKEEKYDLLDSLIASYNPEVKANRKIALPDTEQIEVLADSINKKEHLESAFKRKVKVRKV